MREIEFRAKSIDDNECKSIDNNKWVYGSLLGIIDINEKKTYHILDEVGIGLNIDQTTIGQYTGLKDKNGIKIFEGDIIKSFQIFPNSERYEVIRQVEWMGDRFYPFANDELEYGDWWEELTKNCKVMGNIYDNTELLGVKNVHNNRISKST